eukprot:3879430-Ditylum_brightwellii.AAC.1
MTELGLHIETELGLHSNTELGLHSNTELGLAYQDDKATILQIQGMAVLQHDTTVQDNIALL